MNVVCEYAAIGNSVRLRRNPEQRAATSGVGRGAQAALPRRTNRRQSDARQIEQIEAGAVRLCCVKLGGGGSGIVARGRSELQRNRGWSKTQRQLTDCAGKLIH